MRWGAVGAGTIAARHVARAARSRAGGDVAGAVPGSAADDRHHAPAMAAIAAVERGGS